MPTAEAAAVLLIEPHTRRRSPAVEVVVPVYNEEADLEASVRRLHDYLCDRFPLDWVVTIADNASTDRTWPIACRLASELGGVRAVHLDRKGRGRALRATWSASEAQVVAYMDVDLSTDLNALLPLVAPLLSGHSDVAIGSRLAPGSRVVRGPRREAISRCYNVLLRTVLHAGFSDAQCGFKAARADAAKTLLPLVEDDAWFFDTELLVVAEANGLRIHEVPVDWVDDPDSRVDVVRTAGDDLRGVARMLGRLWRGRVMLPREAAPRGAAVARAARCEAARAGNTDRGGGDDVHGTRMLLGPRRVSAGPSAEAPTADGLASQLVRFASIGVVSTVLFGSLFALLDGPLGPVPAVVLAMAACAVANTAANRRLTFSLRGRAGRARDLALGAFAGVVPLALALGALAALAVAGVTSPGARVAAVTAASAGGSLARFVFLRSLALGRLPDRRRLRQVVRYAGVSVVATVTSLTVLAVLVSTNAVPAGWANVMATLAGITPSFVLNRRWVWGLRGRTSLAAEVVPFVAMSLTALVLSTAAVSWVARVADAHGAGSPARTAAVLAANVTVFGSLWVLQFLLLDRVLFRRRSRVLAA
ncbi:MAG TPA: bifunctional glycosyltransferase family 2/GtrA family protein [Acidimicrobiales bacterium]|nr:bifunctional glycosyltransferase family 2/GtrA family protein [Acidimicrobiales bacterium]